MFGLRRLPPGGWPVAGSAMTYGPANPNDPSTADFDCGSEWYEEEVNKTVREGKWAKVPEVTALEFKLDGKSVGFAFMVNKHYPYPDWSAKVTALTRLIYTVGINKRYRGTKDPFPGSTATLAEVMFRVIEDLPRGVIKSGKMVGEVQGLFLQVYVDNKHARRFYRKVGFAPDVARGVFCSGPSESRTLALRKPLP